MDRKTLQFYQMYEQLVILKKFRDLAEKLIGM